MKITFDNSNPFLLSYLFWIREICSSLLICINNYEFLGKTSSFITFFEEITKVNNVARILCNFVFSCCLKYIYENRKTTLIQCTCRSHFRTFIYYSISQVVGIFVWIVLRILHQMWHEIIFQFCCSCIIMMNPFFHVKYKKITL